MLLVAAVYHLSAPRAIFFIISERMMDDMDHDFASLIPEMKDKLEAGKESLSTHLKSLDLPLQTKMNAVFVALFGHSERQFSIDFWGLRDIVLGLVAHIDSIQAQLVVLHAFEFFCNKVAKLGALAAVYWVFKRLYDISFLDDDVCYIWYRDGSTGATKDSPVWKAVKPFADYYLDLDESCLSYP